MDSDMEELCQSQLQDEDDFQKSVPSTTKGTKGTKGCRKTLSAKKKDVTDSVKSLVVSKKISKSRPPPRPYKSMPFDKLKANIETLQDRIAVLENKAQTYTIRLKKFNTEYSFRKSVADVESDSD